MSARTVAAPPLPHWHHLREAVRATLHLGAREIRIVMRMPANFIPGLFIPAFFYFVMVGSLSELAGQSGLANYRAFQLPLSILFAVTSGSAGLNMVTDIETGYFDKLLLTPAHRLAILVGAMGADFLRVFLQGVFVTGLALVAGLEFATGVTGALVMVVIASLWGMAFEALGFAIALKTGNSQATQSSWAIFMPFVFLTTAFAPMEALSGWLRTAARFNPMTYLLRGLRALSMTGWDWSEIGIGLLAVAGVGAVTLTLAVRAMLGRIR